MNTNSRTIEILTASLRNRTFYYLLVCVATLACYTPATAADTMAVQSRLRSDPQLSLFTKAIDIAQLWEKLTQYESFTLFVPTDDGMSREQSDFLLHSVLMTTENRKRLSDMVSAHIVASTVEFKRTDGEYLLPAISGDCLTTVHSGDSITVGPDASVLSIEMFGEAQVVTVDKLLIPDYQVSDACRAIHDQQRP